MFRQVAYCLCFVFFKLMQGKLADMYVSLQSSRAFLYMSAMAADNGFTDNKNCAAVLLMCSENSVKTTLEGIQCLGNQKEKKKGNLIFL